PERPDEKGISRITPICQGTSLRRALDLYRRHEAFARVCSRTKHSKRRRPDTLRHKEPSPYCSVCSREGPLRAYRAT
ncbi:hypothetical protein BGY98DRAFT_956982, partial [Russula aff. rugulosa BPL654]